MAKKPRANRPAQQRTQDPTEVILIESDEDEDVHVIPRAAPRPNGLKSKGFVDNGNKTPSPSRFKARPPSGLNCVSRSAAKSHPIPVAGIESASRHQKTISRGQAENGLSLSATSNWAIDVDLTIENTDPAEPAASSAIVTKAHEKSAAPTNTPEANNKLSEKAILCASKPGTVGNNEDVGEPQNTPQFIGSAVTPHINTRDRFPQSPSKVGDAFGKRPSEDTQITQVVERRPGEKIRILTPPADVETPKLNEFSGPFIHDTPEDTLEVLDFETIRQKLHKYEALLRKNTEETVKSRLKRAERMLCKAPGPSLDRSLPDPFAKLPASSLSSTLPTLRLERQQKLPLESSAIPMRTKKKPELLYLDVKDFKSDAQYVPKAKSIGRLGASRDMLARNVKTLRYLPWFPDNEETSSNGNDRYEELERNYTDNHDARSRRRRCREMANMWRPAIRAMFEEFDISEQDVLYYLLHEDENEEPQGVLSEQALDRWNQRAEDCPSCAGDDDPPGGCIERAWRRVGSQLKRPSTERRLAIAGLVCDIFYTYVGMNLWHVISDTKSAGLLLDDLLNPVKNTTSADRMDAYCYICGLFHCPTHGVYHQKSPAEDTQSEDLDSTENDFADEATEIHQKETAGSIPESSDGDIDDEDSDGHDPLPEVMLDDEEVENNIRQYAALPVPRHSPANGHFCGILCVDNTVQISEILGLHPDGAARGIAREGVEETSSPFDDSEICDSKVCFWDVKQRQERDLELFEAQNLDKWFEEDTEMLKVMMPSFLNSRRGPCEIAMCLSKGSCYQVFFAILNQCRSTKHPVAPHSAPGTLKEPPPDLSLDKALEARTAFVPCSHDGPCYDNNACSCTQGKISCEPSCGCDLSCRRRFQGCRCRRSGRKYCLEDGKCECWKNNRECDPRLCGNCGVQEVLDPVNRRSEQHQNDHCKNNRIQLGIPKRTVMGVSEVHGWGLYAGEDIAKLDFISEYKGELISIPEVHRRGAVYHNLGQEYLFKLSKDQELDGSRFSNKARFINNSSKSKNINVVAKKMLCNGVVRIMLYAERKIMAGEELFYHYGYEKRVTKDFKEKPDYQGTKMRLSLQMPPDSLRSEAVADHDLLESEPPSTDEDDEQDEIEGPKATQPSEQESEFEADVISPEESSMDESMAEDSKLDSDSDSERRQRQLDAQLDAKGLPSKTKQTDLTANASQQASSSGAVEGYAQQVTSENHLVRGRGRYRPRSIGNSSSYRSQSETGQINTGQAGVDQIAASPNDRPKKKPRIHFKVGEAPQEGTETDKDKSNRDALRRSSGVPRSHFDDVVSRNDAGHEIHSDAGSTRRRVPSWRIPADQRKRKISSTDRRFGGEVQRRAAEARRRRLETEAAAAAGNNPATDLPKKSGMKRKRSVANFRSTDAPTGTQPSAQPLPFSVNRKSAFAGRQTTTPMSSYLSTVLGSDRGSRSTSMSESSASISPHRVAPVQPSPLNPEAPPRTDSPTPSQGRPRGSGRAFSKSASAGKKASPASVKGLKTRSTARQEFAGSHVDKEAGLQVGGGNAGATKMSPSGRPAREGASLPGRWKGL